MASTKKTSLVPVQTCISITEKYFYTNKKQAWSKYKHAFTHIKTVLHQPTKYGMAT